MACGDAVPLTLICVLKNFNGEPDEKNSVCFTSDVAHTGDGQ